MKVREAFGDALFITLMCLWFVIGYGLMVTGFIFTVIVLVYAAPIWLLATIPGFVIGIFLAIALAIYSD